MTTEIRGTQFNFDKCFAAFHAAQRKPGDAEAFFYDWTMKLINAVEEYATEAEGQKQRADGLANDLMNCRGEVESYKRVADDRWNEIANLRMQVEIANLWMQVASMEVVPSRIC